MSVREIKLPMVIEDNLELFDKVVALCHRSEFRCRKYREFMKGYLEVSELNIRLSEIGLAEDVNDLIGYENTLGNGYL
ncbi:MAG: hypothetical protein GX947_08815 [Tissierellia bacterium]|nr:hypothetical protein [Tissierellia bacterium]